MEICRSKSPGEIDIVDFSIANEKNRNSLNAAVAAKPFVPVFLCVPF
jgi:hypothetical protein